MFNTLNFTRAGRCKGRSHITGSRPIDLRSAHVRLFREADYLKSLVTRLMKPSVLSTLQKAISIINSLAVRITPSSRIDSTMMGVMVLGLTVNELLKIERTQTSGNYDKVKLKKCF